MKVIWIASYPRSGNTLLRTVLWQCFGLRSTSVYPGDLGGRRELENYVGHVERNADNSRAVLSEMDLPLIKTHEYPTDNNPAIYVVRNGIHATVSMWQFQQRKLPLEAIIRGQNRFGTWSDHVRAWSPCTRPDTLLVRYEEMVSKLPLVLSDLGSFLGRGIKSAQIPDRNSIAGVDGRWVRTKRDKEFSMSGDMIDLFNQLNEGSMRGMGY